MNSPQPPLDQLPGFRRRFRITVASGRVQSEVEDDIHCMSVIVHHDGVVATAVEPEMRRVPWSTCPGALEQLKQTFTGVELKGFARRGEKQSNCTHLHDLAILAAEHAFEPSVVYDILVSDPIDGKRRAELRRNGETILGWVEEGFKLIEPAEVAGLGLMDNMRTWIDSLSPLQQRAARLLRWGNMIANGRIIPLEQQSDATKMPPNCYTFQPDRAKVAKRVGVVRDFSGSAAEPLGDYKPAV